MAKLPNGSRLSCEPAYAAARQSAPATGCLLVFQMPRKQKQTEQEIHDMIVTDAKIRLGCADFAPDFTLRKAQDQWANWDLDEAHNAETWTPDCAQAFAEAVARARRKFDVAWP